ncbi:MAG: hypothetical protein WAM66_09810 [Acidobacteriaceae bacterium]
MIELTSLVSHFGLPAVLGAALVFILFRGEVQFRYPRKNSSSLGRRKDQEITAKSLQSAITATPKRETGRGESDHKTNRAASTR